MADALQAGIVTSVAIAAALLFVRSWLPRSAPSKDAAPCPKCSSAVPCAPDEATASTRAAK